MMGRRAMRTRPFSSRRQGTVESYRFFDTHYFVSKPQAIINWHHQILSHQFINVRSSAGFKRPAASIGRQIVTNRNVDRFIAKSCQTTDRLRRLQRSGKCVICTSGVVLKVYSECRQNARCSVTVAWRASIRRAPYSWHDEIAS